MSRHLVLALSVLLLLWQGVGINWHATQWAQAHNQGLLYAWCGNNTALLRQELSKVDALFASDAATADADCPYCQLLHAGAQGYFLGLVLFALHRLPQHFSPAPSPQAQRTAIVPFRARDPPLRIVL